MNISKKATNLLISLTVLAAVSFILQVSKGLSITGMREPVHWGLYIINFTTCTGIGAGLLFFQILAWLRTDVSADSRLKTSIAAFFCLALAAIFIILDLGRIDRVLYMIIYGQTTSALFWDFIMLKGLILLSLSYIYFNFREINLQRPTDNSKIGIDKHIYNLTTINRNIRLNKFATYSIHIVSMIVTTGMFLITTEVFAGLKSHPVWHSIMLPIVFTTSALLGAFAIIFVLSENSTPKQQTLNRHILISMILINLIAILLKAVYDITNPLIGLSRSWFPWSFWISIIIGNILPIIIIMKSKVIKISKSIGVSGLLLLGLVLKRTEVIIPAYYHQWMPFPKATIYIPTIPEVLIVLGAYSAAFLVFNAVLKHIQSK